MQGAAARSLPPNFGGYRPVQPQPMSSMPTMPMLSARFDGQAQSYSMLVGAGAPQYQPGHGQFLPPTTLLAPAPTSPTSPAATSPGPRHSEAAETEPCSEEACNNEAQGEERKNGEYVFFGVDFKPALPPALAVSTVLGAVCTSMVQIPLLGRLALLPQAPLFIVMITLNVATLVCMGYCTFADPGQTKRKRNMVSMGRDLEEGHNLPQRAHKSWQYARPIRRYDHYCKWLHNVIGLLNHREFVLMLFGLCLIGLLGVIVDGYLAVLIAKKGMFHAEISVALHLAYSLALLAIEVPILKIHLGLVSRNELAQEWKNNLHYVAHNTTQGDHVPVENLDDDEYNTLFDQGAFVYDAQRNQWDQGCSTNWWNFWCRSRWAVDERGEF